jgi:hypothetical protein
MTEPVFPEKSKMPDDKALAGALGKRWKLYKKMSRYLEDDFGDIRKEWKFYMKKTGWTLRILQEKRAILYLGPQKSFFKVTFVFGKKAQEVVEKSDLPDHIKKTLRDAKQYMEGKGLQLDIKLVRDLNIVKKLIRIKLEN